MIGTLVESVGRLNELQASTHQFTPGNLGSRVGDSRGSAKFRITGTFFRLHQLEAGNCFRGAGTRRGERGARRKCYSIIP